MGTPDLDSWTAAMHADGYSPNTIRARLLTVRAFSSAAGVDPARLDQTHVVAYLGSRSLGARSRRAYLDHLRAWQRWARIDGLTDGIRRPPQPRGVPRPITEAQLTRLLLACPPASRVRAWLVLGAYSGLRAHESAQVAADDLEPTATGWALRVLGKGGKVALATAPPIVVEELRPWCDRVGEGRLWPEATSNAVQQALKRLGQRAGVRFSSHQLRHRYGTAMYEATGRDLLRTQEAMRHASPAMTAGYALVGADDVRRAANRLPGAVPGQPRGEQLW